jgi:hypothetical protein
MDGSAETPGRTLRTTHEEAPSGRLDYGEPCILAALLFT